MRRKFTESGRATVVQEFRMIVEPELGVDPNATRKISLLTPGAPNLVFCITPYVLRQGGETTTIETARDLGLDQNYKGVPLPVSSLVHFELLAGQGVIAAAVKEQGFLGVIVEYL